MWYDLYSWQSLPLTFMHCVNRVKPHMGFEPSSPDWEVDNLPTELERHTTHNVHNCMEQQHGTFEIRLYQNSRQLGISLYGWFSIYHIQLILDFFHIFWRLVQWHTKYMDASWRWLNQLNSQIIWEFIT